MIAILQADRRLILLALMARARGNVSAAALHCDVQELGHPYATLSDIRVDLEWLAERGLAAPAAGITRRGREIAAARPSGG